MSNVCVIGAGAAGMMAAITAAKNGNKVTVYEKNEKLGKKIFITGKGRCNVTNAGDFDALFSNVITNSKFLFSSIYGYSNIDVCNFFEEMGCHLKTERGDRVFPVSDKAGDVIDALRNAMKKNGVTVKLNTQVQDILIEDNVAKGIILKNNTEVQYDKVIVATGGLSYPTTGSTGDGIEFARNSGHKIVECNPSLVPFETQETWVKDVMGLALKNVSIELINEKKVLYSGFGEMLFTHFGVSGPLVLSASCYYKKRKSEEVKLYIDLKPALDEDTLDKRLLKDFEENKNKVFKNSLNKLFPAGLIPVMVEYSQIDPEKKVNEITKAERQNFVKIIKRLPLTITGTRSFAEAIITQGGVSVKDINPSTMESKVVSGLYFAGEVLDLDAMTGGFNLQIAWSTGHLAGENV